MITSIKEYLEALKDEYPRLHRTFKVIYEVTSSEGSLKIPEEMLNLFDAAFLESARKQRVISIYNKWTGEGALFNSMRLRKPVHHHTRGDDHLKMLMDTSGCDFCSPETRTPEDVFGRIRGEHSITASNIAKYDAWSGLLIFKNHNPLQFNLNELSDYLKTSSRWFKEAEAVSGFNYPLIIWNCLPRAGASQVHGHMQLLLGQRPYARIGLLDRVAGIYRARYGSSYHEDVFRVHEALGLGIEYGDKGVYASITPVKEREINLIFRSDYSDDLTLQRLLFKILRYLIDVKDVCSFNLMLHPVNGAMEIPGIIRIVDRGPISSMSSDIGGMELFGSSIIGEDPYRLMDELRGVLDA